MQDEEDDLEKKEDKKQQEVPEVLRIFGARLQPVKQIKQPEMQK